MKQLLVLATLLLSFSARASEPAYCDARAFKRAAIKYSAQDLERLKIYKLGRIHLAGLAVGNSEVRDVQTLAQSFSKAGQAEGYCTWYFNEGNDQAERLFQHAYVENPRDLNLKEAPTHYRKILENFFNPRNRTTFLACAENFEFIAMGCNGMKHRGPTVFGMLLAFSGCSAENSARIVNETWGLNGVPEDTRLAIIREGTKLGELNPEAREKLSALFSQNQ